MKKLKTSITTFLFVWTFCAVSLAQPAMEDVILLKTAEVIRGEIQQNIEGEYVEILVQDSLL